MGRERWRRLERRMLTMKALYQETFRDGAGDEAGPRLGIEICA